ncbi:hypothetical protein N7461_005146 [Penicillium sp. DV-2018c]|nr:hypothetical protein N7461_005146 [Penicillium sp. DV-2018c]
MSQPYDQPIIDIVNYVYHYALDSGDEEIWKSARTALLDALSCAIETSATSAECRKLLGPVIDDTIVPDGFRVPGTELQVDPVKGAFDLGVLIRYLDHNDALGGAEWGHPSGNAKLGQRWDGALMLMFPPLTMRTLLVALVKAYEIQGCYQMQNAFNSYGIDHVVLVKVASAAVVCWVLGSSEGEAMATLSHVWMDGQPSRVYRSGANTVPRKGWAAGDAARRAVQLALLVRDGQPGSPGALSAKPWGFWERTFGERGFVFPRPFGSWTVRNVLFKTMPVEGHAISAVEAAVLHARLLRQKGLSDPLEQIRWIDLRTTAAASLIINKHGPLHNAADRDHCIQYVVALAFLKASPPDAVDYLDESPWATSERLEVLRGRIVVQPDTKLTEDYLDLDKKSIGAGMTVHLADGTSMPEILVEYPVGHSRNPKTPAAVQEKFFRNMGLLFDTTEIGRMLGAVQNQDTLISDFMNLFIRPSSEAKL